MLHADGVRTSLTDTATRAGAPPAQVIDLISKRMVSEGFLSKTQGQYVLGPRAQLSRDIEAATAFRRDRLEA